MRNPFTATGLHRYTRAQERHDRDAARAEVLRLEGVIRILDAKAIERDERISQLEADAVDVSVERQLRAEAERKVEALTARLRIFESHEANEFAITLPPMHRDIDADDVPTNPAGIDVRTLRDALNVA